MSLISEIDRTERFYALDKFYAQYQRDAHLDAFRS